MTVVFLIGTLIGWAMIGHVATKHALRWRRQKHLSRPSEAQKRMERIARLEIACGVGLKYGLDTVMAAKVRVEPHMQRLFDEGNGAVYRDCWGCGKSFKEFDHERDERDGELSVRLCPGCLRNARAELDYGIPLPWDK